MSYLQRFLRTTTRSLPSTQQSFFHPRRAYWLWKEPKDLPEEYWTPRTTEDHEPQWADYRPNLVEVELIRDMDGNRIGVWGGEECVFPDLQFTLEWTLTTPVGEHDFLEQPIVKECPKDPNYPVNLH